MLFDIDDFFTRDETLMTADDEAAVVCNDCTGCTNCCRELSGRIVLDSWDISLLKKGLNRSFDELIENGSIRLAEKDGVLLPAFGLKKGQNECVFLGGNGRCSIHPWRGGICRMYPLARLWHDDGTFSYYMQRGECGHTTGEKMKISEWLGYPDTAAYESAIMEYHRELKEYRRACRNAGSEEELGKIREDFFDRNFRRK